ncbi:MAG: hypothetical protein ACI8TX_000330 [Hyphomicrobiaceae bacterium]|jgi:hypothetical protein
MIPHAGGASRSEKAKRAGQAIAPAMAVALWFSLAPSFSMAESIVAESEIITVTAHARADYVSPHKRRMQMNSGSETVARQRNAETTAAGKPPPHFVTYDFGYGWRYKMTNDAHQIVVQHEHLLERLGSLEPGLDGRFKRFMAIDGNSAIDTDGYRIITRDEARASLHLAEVRFKLEVLGMNLPAHERHLVPSQPPGQGNSPNYALYRGRKSPNDGVPMDAGSGMFPATNKPQAPTIAVQPAPAAPAVPAARPAVPTSPQHDRAAREGVGSISTATISRTKLPVVTFPKLEATEPVATAPTNTASLKREPKKRPAARPASAVQMDSTGVVTPRAGEPSIAREHFAVNDIEPPMEGDVPSGPVHRASAPKESPVRRAVLPESASVGRASLPGSAIAPAVVSIPTPTKAKPKAAHSRAVLKADAALPPMLPPPAPPPGFFAPGERAPAAAVRQAPAPRPAARPLVRPAAVQSGKPATLPTSGHSDRLSIPAPMGEPQVWADTGEKSEGEVAAQTRSASVKSAAAKPSKTSHKLASDKDARVVRAEPNQPRARVISTVDEGPLPPPEYRTKHGDRDRVAPDFHTPSDNLWKRVGARNGNQALSAH